MTCGSKLITQTSQWVCVRSTGNGQPTVTGSRNLLLGEADGVHVQWSWDGRELVCTNCDLGFYPVYYCDLGNGIVISPHILKIAACVDQLSLDLSALSVFLRFGYFLGNDTPFTSIRQLPPGSTLRWRDGVLSLNSRGYLRVPRQNLEREVAQRRFTELFHAALRRAVDRSPGRIVIPLSGGQDSRQILLGLRAIGVLPEFVITQQLPAPRTLDDVKIAQMLASRLQLRHVVVKQPASYAKNYSRLFLETGFCADEGLWAYPMISRLRGECETVTDGIAGDGMVASVFSSRHLASLFEKKDLNGAVEYMFRQHSAAECIFDVLAPDFADAISLPLAKSRVAEAVAEQLEANDPRMFYLFNRTRREIALAPFLLFRDFKVITPFLDRELWTFMASLPTEMIIDGTFRISAMAQAYPGFSDIPFERKGITRKPTLTEDYGFFLSWLIEVAKSPSFEFINGAALLSRGFRSIFNRQFWWMPERILYLLMLSGLLKQKHGTV